MSTQSTDQAILEAKRTTDAVIGVGDARGWERPAEYGRHITIGAAAKTAAREAEPAPIPKPTTADDVEKWLDKTAAARVTAAARREVALELAVDSDRQVARLGQQIASQSIPRLVEEFADEVRTYEALANAPRTLTGHESDAQLADHAALLRAASNLATTLQHRALLALAAGEAEDIGRDPVWLVIAIDDSATLNSVSDAVRELRDTMPATVAQWDRLAPLGLALAQEGEVAARQSRHSAANYTRGMSTPDGGVVDRTYAEVESGRNTGTGARLSGETNAMFDRTPALARQFD